MDRLLLVLCVLYCALLPGGAALTRVYYIAAVEMDWNYAPTGRNIINPQAQR